MKRIFRSIIDVKKGGMPTIPYDELIRNYKAFESSHVLAEDPSYLQIYHWIEAHFRKYKELPSIDLLKEKAQNEGSEIIFANLEEILVQTPFYRSDYQAILKEKFEEQNSSNFKEILNKTWQVASSGLKIGKNKQVKGIDEALNYFIGEARKFRYASGEIKTEGEIRSVEDQKEVIEAYQLRKKNPTVGLFTNIDKIDEVFRGVQLGHLFIVAAYVSQGKTTFVANMAYNGIMQGMNGAYVSLEMTYEEMRDLMYVLHCSNPDWYKHPKYKHLAGKISYDKVRHGELNELEEEFFITASEDFKNRPDFGKLELMQYSGITPSVLEMELYDRKAKLSESGRNLEFAIIDYVGLMSQDKELRSGDVKADLNHMLKRLKAFALNFDSGRGLRVITPHQINREGYKEAIKNEGIYRITALSDANESERSADGVVALYMNEDMRRHGTIKVTCLKNRHGAIFSPFDANLDVSISKCLRDAIQVKGNEGINDEAMAIANVMDTVLGD